MSDASSPAAPPAPEPKPRFAAMPGAGKGAVVLMWIMFGFGACGGAVLIGLLPLAVEHVPTSDWAGLWRTAPESVLLVLLYPLYMIVWTVMRGVLAVRVVRRSARGRSGAIVLEATDVLVSIGWTLLLAGVEAPEPNSGASVGEGLPCVGIVLSLIVVGLLSTRDVREWCIR